MCRRLTKREENAPLLGEKSEKTSTVEKKPQRF